MEAMAILVRLPFFLAGLFFLTLGYMLFIPLALLLFFIVAPICFIVSLPVKFVVDALSNDLRHFQWELDKMKDFFRFEELRKIFEFNPYRNLCKWWVGEKS